MDPATKMQDGGAPDMIWGWVTFGKRIAHHMVPAKLMAMIIFTMVQLQLYSNGLSHHSSNHFPIILHHFPMVSINS